MSEKRQKKSKTGIVVSDKMDKSRVVAVDQMTLHPVFKKYYRKTKKFHVHDEKNEAKAGDMVEIIECRPMSRLKRWRLKSIVRKAAA
ncbi:MAG: 30S ribosomal protein S17 [Deltaproteobacteria bacterium]|nr:30S ribosomal protein S17 [Deltaproteobacteria bacterium]